MSATATDTKPGPIARALVLAGGLGTRLRPLTDRLPKCLVPVGGRPLLDYWVDALADAGVGRAVINNHAHPEQVRGHIAAVRASGRLDLLESFEPTLLGSAGTVAANAGLADGADEVIIVYADNFSGVDLGRMLTFHRNHPDPFTILLFHAPNPRACGIADLDAEGRVVSFVEKPETPKSDLANAGVYVLDADAYREAASLGAFDLGFEVLPRFVGRMRGYAPGGYHLDVGTPEALARADADAAAVKPRRPAVFLDRDGTIIEHVHYIGDPADVRIAPGAGSALRRLDGAGFALVGVTNQSAVGRGIITLDQLAAVNAEMVRQLGREGVRLDALYHCPEVPTVDDRAAVTHGDRKPGPGMLLRGAKDLGIDPGRSWMVGDLISDALAGRNAGCRGSILLRSGPTAPAEGGEFPVVDDLGAAADLILQHAEEGPDAR